MFQKGDFIVEYERSGRMGGIKFGVVMGAEKGFDDRLVLDVMLPNGRLYTFACHCQPYQEWLNEQL